MADDAAWAGVAANTRAALRDLGYTILPQCLPGEIDACGGTFAEHAAAHLAAIQAVADHQLDHLAAPADLIEDVYNRTAAELRDHSGCTIPEAVT